MNVTVADSCRSLNTLRVLAGPRRARAFDGGDSPTSGPEFETSAYKRSRLYAFRFVKVAFRRTAPDPTSMSQSGPTQT
jgi:hypothetical protein